MTNSNTTNNLLPVTLTLSVIYMAISFIQVGCTDPEPSSDKTILVFAAVSLVESMSKIETKFEEQYDVNVSVSFGGSQMLAQQIIRGAPADIFIPAGNFQISDLQAHDLIYGEPTDILRNQLVIISRPEISISSLNDLRSNQFRKIAKKKIFGVNYRMYHVCTCTKLAL